MNITSSPQTQTLIIDHKNTKPVVSLPDLNGFGHFMGVTQFIVGSVTNIVLDKGHYYAFESEVRN